VYTFIADTETNGFRATVFHSLVIIHAETSDSYSFADQPGFPQISDGIRCSKRQIRSFVIISWGST
jgi:hypothetical protein